MIIENDIPIPSRRSGRKLSEVGEMAMSLEVSQSVLCEDRKVFEIVRAALRRAGRKAVSRKMNKGWRVWRVE